MARRSTAHRARSITRGLAGAGVLLTLVSLLNLIRQPSDADTVGSPDPVVTASVGSQTNIAPNTAALTGLDDGTTVSITVTATGNLAGVDARQCWGGAQTIQLQAQFNPTQGGNCVDVPLSANSDDFISNAVGAPNNAVTFNFRVGEGTRIVTYGAASNTRTITCDDDTNCTLWFKVSILAGGDAAGAVWKHYNLDFGAVGGTTTTTGSTTTTTGSTTTTTGSTTSTTGSTTTTTGSTTTTTGSTTSTTGSTTSTTGSTTTTSGSSTTTTEDPTTTTSDGSSSSSSSSIPAVVPTGGSPSVAGTQTAGGLLPRTGTEAVKLLWSATSLAGGGALLSIAAERRRRAAMG